MECISNYVKDGSVAIDIGSNIGFMSLSMSKFVGDKGKVLAFEPGPVSNSLLRRNVYVNNASAKIVVVDAAVSDFNGSVSLFINPTGESDNQVHKDVEHYHFKDELFRPKISVVAVKLDSALDNLNIKYSDVSFVKIDTQGHDLSVLRGGRGLFSKSTQIAILCEFSPYLKAWENQTIDEFYDELISLGFDVYDYGNLKAGIVEVNYLKSQYGFDKPGKYTDLLLLKGLSPK